MLIVNVSFGSQMLLSASVPVLFHTNSHFYTDSQTRNQKIWCHHSPRQETHNSSKSTVRCPKILPTYAVSPLNSFPITSCLDNEGIFLISALKYNFSQNTMETQWRWLIFLPVLDKWRKCDCFTALKNSVLTSHPSYKKNLSNPQKVFVVLKQKHARFWKNFAKLFAVQYFWHTFFQLFFT